MVQEITVQWKRPEISLSELANLRWTEGWTIQRLARHFRCGTTKVIALLKEMKNQEATHAAS